MDDMKSRAASLVVLAAALMWGAHRFISAAETGVAAQSASPATNQVPVYEWDPTWPRQPFPKNWVVGAVVGVATDAKDHIWVVHRPKGAVPGTQGECCVSAPAVIEFDQAGSVVQ